jgi:thymidine kinase
MNDSRKFHGKIQLILGPMFSGKSTELCRRYKRNLVADLRCVLIKFSGDNRYCNSKVMTHDGESLTAIATKRLMDLNLDPADYDTIFIDEVQFYEDKYEFCEAMANAGVNIVACGLLANWERKPFPGMSQLEAVAFSIETLLAICSFCKKEKACFSLRLTSEKGDVVIGGTEKYRAVCRYCYHTQTQEG